MIINGQEYTISPMADLCGADLHGADLRGADLCGADLCVANLGGADLGGAYLWGANLGGANLSGANLSGANLSEANLDEANLGEGRIIRALRGRAYRSDNYEYLIFSMDNGNIIRAGCRTFTPEEFRAHVAKKYPGTPKAVETLRIIDFLEAQAAVEKW